MDRHAAFVNWATNRRADRAQALLDADPALATAGSDVALLLGDVDAAATVDPRAPLGQRGWLPLLYVTHSAFLGGPRTVGLLACAERLLDAGADPDAAWRHPEFGALSALYGAAGVAHEPRMTALLLSRGASPDDDESVYHACESRDHTCLRLLLDAGARVDGTNAVAHMLDYDDLDGLRLLLDAGATDLDGTITHAIARERSRAHVELLLAAGAPVPSGAATLAVRRGRADLAGLLDEAAPTPADELIGALRRGDSAAVDDVLARHPGLLDALDRGDHDVLVYAAGTGNRPALELMLGLGFPIDVRSEELNETPLHAAAWYGKADMVRVLLEHGADPNAEAGPPFGGTPLDWAARGSRYADQSVLGDASTGDHVATVEVLLAAGARLVQPTTDRTRHGEAMVGSLDSASEEVAPLLEQAV